MKIRYLLMHAYGTGGTIRTVFNQAGSMAAAGHDVEIASMQRTRDEPHFPLHPEVTITTLVDQRPGAREAELAAAGPRAAEKRVEREGQPPRHIPPGEFAYDRYNRHVEDTVIAWLERQRDAVIVPTRPGLNFLTARFTPRSCRRIAQEHMNLGTHPSDIRTAIQREYPRFDAVAVLTHGDREDYQELLPDTRVVRIPNAVHTGDKKLTTYAEHVAVAAGRLFPQKGFDMLIPAWAQLVEKFPDWQLRIFGTGEKKAELRRLINENHLYNHVFLMGHTHKLDDELARASFYVLSSRFEGLPMVMIESMTHGLPVVSFDCPTGPADVLTHGKDGLLVPRKDVDGLAEAMGQLMDDEGLRADMGAAALQTSRSYTPEAVHPQWEALFEEIHGSGSA
ncbi:glycosyltransferase family 4 protein [Streptomyces phytophilus]|uniref:glycosyltransferase family 4 protein n=1 Tax=Streptomyces phytophilus TaxID=722715 RepID=UPI0015F05CDC|nr:glycosyltransferase family 4 protein [Streptomyces phytophilus]